MKAKFDKLPKFIKYIVVEGATKLSQTLDKNITSLWPEMFEKDRDEWDIQLILNGKELPVLDTFELLESGFEQMVEERAEQLLLDRCQNLTEIINCAEEALEESFKTIMHPDEGDNDGI